MARKKAEVQVRKQKHNFAVDKAHRCEFTLLGEDFDYVRISIDDNDCY